MKSLCYIVGGTCILLGLIAKDLNLENRELKSELNKYKNLEEKIIFREDIDLDGFIDQYHFENGIRIVDFYGKDQFPNEY